MRPSVMRALPSILILILVAASCAAPSDVPAAPLDPGAALAADDGATVLVGGSLVASGGEARLCAALAESYPPQCAGESVVLEGLDLDQVVGLNRPPDAPADGLAWSDFLVAVRGTVEGEVVAVTELVQVAAEATEGDFRLRFAPHPVPLRSEEPVSWVLDLTNLGDQPITVDFNPAQPAEVVLFREGEEVYRFTEGKAFTQSLETRDLVPGEPVGFVLHDQLPVPPGTYTASATFVGSVPVRAVEIIVTVES